MKNDEFEETVSHDGRQPCSCCDGGATYTQVVAYDGHEFFVNIFIISV